jgi:hypothetical protein
MSSFGRQPEEFIFINTVCYLPTLLSNKTNYIIINLTKHFRHTPKSLLGASIATDPTAQSKVYR